VTDAQCFDPALLPEGERDKKAELDQLVGGKVLMQLLPERVVSDF
jgi:hypothetical protein